jgi:hypothetical protein
VEPDNPPADIQAKILAGRLLTLGARHSSEALDQFSSWLLGGFGAASALLIVNVENVSKHLAIGSLRSAVWLFLIMLLLGAFSKLLASILRAAGGAAAESESMGRDLADDEVEVNFKTVFRETEKATLPPMRMLVASSLRKVEGGDFAASGRLYAKLAQIQSFIVFVEVVLAAAAALVLACGLAV